MRRTRRFGVSGELWVELLRSKDPQTYLVTRNQLPADARCVGVMADPLETMVWIWVQSDHFGENDPEILQPPEIRVMGII